MNKLNIYAILFLIIIYLVINVLYKNIKALILFLVSLTVLMIFMKDKINAIILAYIISIMFGIVNNFHLLENFTSNRVTIPSSLKSIPAMISKPKKKQPEKKETFKKEVDLEIDMFNTEYELDEICNKVVIKNLLNKLNTIGYEVTNTQMEYSNMNPIVNKLQSELLKKMMDQIREGKLTFNERIIISNDNYIIHGHYLWYSKGIFLQENSNIVNDTYDKNMNVTMIDMDIKTFISKLEKYDIDYNATLFERFNKNKKNMDTFKNAIESLDQNLNDLKEMYKTNFKIKLS
jgi:hypothetical protein